MPSPLSIRGTALPSPCAPSPANTIHPNAKPSRNLERKAQPCVFVLGRWGGNRVDISPGTNPSLNPDCLILCYIPAMHTPSNLVRSLPASALFALCLSVCANLAANTKPKEPAPRFNARSTSGESFSNASIKGKVVLLEFWTTWCGYCRAEAPFLEKISHEYT